MIQFCFLFFSACQAFFQRAAVVSPFRQPFDNPAGLLRLKESRQNAKTPISGKIEIV